MWTDSPNNANLYRCWTNGEVQDHGARGNRGTLTVGDMDSATRYRVAGWVVGSAGTWSGWIPATTTGSATIRHVTLTSSPASGDTYRTGEKIRAELTWSQVVTVDNGGSDDNVAVRLDLGSDDGDYSNSRRATSYVSGTGSDTLTFEYTVQRDIDADGVWVQHKSATENEVVFLANGATLEGGNPDTNNAGLTRRHRLGTTGDPSQKVDGMTTATADAGADRTVLFGTEVTLNGGGSSSETEGASLTYSLAESDDHADFDIDNSGVIRVKANRTLDYETKSSYTVTVEVTDGEDADGKPEQSPTIDDSIVVTISVTNVEEPPGAQTNVSVRAVPSSSVRVTWRAPAQSGAAAITDYDLRYYAAAPIRPTRRTGSRKVRRTGTPTPGRAGRRRSRASPKEPPTASRCGPKATGRAPGRVRAQVRRIPGRRWPAWPSSRIRARTRPTG